MKEINLRNILESKLSTEDFNFTEFVKDFILEAMKEACNQTVDLCAENAKCTDGAIIDYGIEQVSASINPHSILNTKNQIK